MVSESNTNRRHLKISNTYDQIHYNTDLYAYKSVITITTLQNQGGHIQKSSISDGSRHGVKYICI